jgi:hypothetical protein
MCWSVRFCFIVVLHVIALDEHFEISVSVNMHIMNLLSFERASQVYFYSDSKLHTAIFTRQLYYVRYEVFTVFFNWVFRSSGMWCCVTGLVFSSISKECSVFSFKVWSWSTVLLWRGNTNPATYHHIWKELYQYHCHLRDIL